MKVTEIRPPAIALAAAVLAHQAIEPAVKAAGLGRNRSGRWSARAHRRGRPGRTVRHDHLDAIKGLPLWSVRSCHSLIQEKHDAGALRPALWIEVEIVVDCSRSSAAFRR